MSKTKYDLKCLISSLSAEANKLKDPNIKQKYYFLKEVAFSKKSIKHVCSKAGYSKDYFYKWANRFLGAKSLSGLKEKSRAPKNIRNKTSPRIIRKIMKLREKEPYLGGERISFKLRKNHKMKCPASTVNDILRREGLIDKGYKKRCTKKHLKRYRRPLPGYIQMDIKYVPYLIEGKQFYEFNAVDHHSSYRVMGLYRDRSIISVIHFLEKLNDEMPFEIIQIQTDNAVEFTDKFSSSRGRDPSGEHQFDRWCMLRLIEHRLIPVGEKEINGKVENTHRFDDLELYSQIDPSSFEELEALLSDYNDRWNNERATKTLGWLTPAETITRAYVKALAMLNLMTEKFSQENTAQKVNIKLVGTAKVEEPRNKRKTKKMTYVDRYLQYLDWEDKKAG